MKCNFKFNVEGVFLLLSVLRSQHVHGLSETTTTCMSYLLRANDYLPFLLFILGPRGKSVSLAVISTALITISDIT